MKVIQSHYLVPEELKCHKLSPVCPKGFRKEYFLIMPDRWLFVTKLKKWLSEDAPSRSLCNKVINH